MSFGGGGGGGGVGEIFDFITLDYSVLCVYCLDMKAIADGT